MVPEAGMMICLFPESGEQNEWIFCALRGVGCIGAWRNVGRQRVEPEGLEALGVRNVVLAGMPLTSSVPAVAQMCRAITGAACGEPQPQPVA